MRPLHPPAPPATPVDIPELLSRIHENLDTATLYRVRRVCKAWDATVRRVVRERKSVEVKITCKWLVGVRRWPATGGGNGNLDLPVQVESKHSLWLSNVAVFDGVK
ncbi:hypothetical protein HDV00_010929, partial [Rhizophlyctis rosea]